MLLYGRKGFNKKLAFGKDCPELQFTAHPLDVLAQRAQQQIGPTLHTRDRRLGNVESFRQFNLRELARLAQLAKPHALEVGFSSLPDSFSPLRGILVLEIIPLDRNSCALPYLAVVQVFPLLFHCIQIIRIESVCLRNHPVVPAVVARFVAAENQHRGPSRIKRIEDAVRPSVVLNAKLSHMRELGTLDAGTTRVRKSRASFDEPFH
jgi:hypothetical protein